MSTSLVYHTQRIAGFQVQSFRYSPGQVVATVQARRGRPACTACGSVGVTPVVVGERLIQGLPMGRQRFFLRVIVRRLKCPRCGAFQREALPFLSHPRARQTRALERFVVELRRHMSISAIASVYGLNWKTVKAIEVRHLTRKYRRIRLKDVRHLGLDEIHVGRGRFLTIAMNLDTGAVLHVVEGRGEDSLRAFARRLKLARARIVAVAVDMAGGYTHWAERHFPDAAIVHDHFHVIKLMNERLDQVRREATRNAATDPERKRIKGRRWLLLRGIEQLDRDARRELRDLWDANRPIAIASMLKEKLRWIYSGCTDWESAATELANWCGLAKVSGIAPLATMARTIRKRWNGILAYWTTRLTTAKLEGFNNKIRWLVRQAFGYADEQYFFLKIHDLPKINTERQL
jgi:transposase